MKLIISEKPSTAQTIAHVVGAREKIYGEGKSFAIKAAAIMLRVQEGIYTVWDCLRITVTANHISWTSCPYSPTLRSFPKTRVPRVSAALFHSLWFLTRLTRSYALRTQDERASSYSVTFTTPTAVKSLSSGYGPIQ